MRLKWFGTASIMIEQNGTRLLFGPFFPLNESTKKQPLDDMSSVDGIFATHGHFDHIADIPAIWCHGGGRDDNLQNG